jgi:hypothetical protein
LAAGLTVPRDASTVQTDAGDWIGWRYRAAGYTKRVRQILVDSTKWDSSRFADGFFDSILIDGGHATDVVISDTNKSLRLLRPGGLLLWHDFCPADPPMIHSAATRGVVNTLHAHWHEWSQISTYYFGFDRVTCFLAENRAPWTGELKQRGSQSLKSLSENIRRDYKVFGA